jgi:hypothetical protein
MTSTSASVRQTRRVCPPILCSRFGRRDTSWTSAHCLRISSIFLALTMPSAHRGSWPKLSVWHGTVDDRAAERRSTLPVPTARTSEIPTLAAREASAGNSVDGDQTGAFAFPDPREAITAALKAAGLLSEPGSTGHPPSGGGFDPRPLITSTLRSVRLLKE